MFARCSSACSDSRGIRPHMGTPGTDAVTLRSELPRKLVHVGMGAFALLLRWLTPWQAMLMAVAALILNSFFLHGITRGALLRLRGAPLSDSHVGVVLYPAILLLTFIVFRSRLELAAGIWALLAVGDGMAALSGLALRGPRLPWNAKKTWSGLVAFVLFGTVGVGLGHPLGPAGGNVDGRRFRCLRRVADAGRERCIRPDRGRVPVGWHGRRRRYGRCAGVAGISGDRLPGGDHGRRARRIIGHEGRRQHPGACGRGCGALGDDARGPGIARCGRSGRNGRRRRVGRRRRGEGILARGLADRCGDHGADHGRMAYLARAVDRSGAVAGVHSWPRCSTRTRLGPGS